MAALRSFRLLYCYYSHCYSYSKTVFLWWGPKRFSLARATAPSIAGATLAIVIAAAAAAAFVGCGTSLRAVPRARAGHESVGRRHGLRAGLQNDFLRFTTISYDLRLDVLTVGDLES